MSNGWKSPIPWMDDDQWNNWVRRIGEQLDLPPTVDTQEEQAAREFGFNTVQEYKEFKEKEHAVERIRNQEKQALYNNISQENLGLIPEMDLDAFESFKPEEIIPTGTDNVPVIFPKEGEGESEEQLLARYRNTGMFDTKTDSQLLDIIGMHEREAIESIPVKDWDPNYLEYTAGMFQNMIENEKIRLFTEIPALWMVARAKEENGLDNPEVRDAFRKNYKSIFPNASDEEVENTLFEFAKDDKLMYSFAADRFRKAEKRRLKFDIDNPKIASIKEWDRKNPNVFGKEEWFNGDRKGVANYLTALTVEGFPSVIQAALSGEAIGRVFQGSAWAAMLAWNATAVKRGGVGGVIGPGRMAALGQTALTLGRGLGQFSYGANMEGLGHMVEGVQTLTEYRELSSEQYGEILHDKQKYFNSLTEDTDIQENMLLNFIQNNFEGSEGRIFFSPVTIEEAIDAVFVSSMHQAFVGGGIETFDVIAKALGIFGPGIRGITRSNIFGKTLKYGDDFVRTLSSVTPNVGKFIPGGVKKGSRLISQYSNFIVDGFAYNAIQGLEEVTQGLHNSAVKIYGPGYNKAIQYRPWLQKRLGEGWKPEAIWSTETNTREMIDEFMSGFLAGGPVHHISGAARLVAGTGHVQNWAIKKQIKSQNSSGYFVEKYGDEYKIVFGVGEYNEETNKTELKKTLLEEDGTYDSSTGEIDKVTFDNFGDANNAAASFNKTFNETNEKFLAWEHKKYFESKPQMIETKDGKFNVILNDEKGKQKSLIGSYDDKKSATKALREAKGHVSLITNYIDKFGGLEQLTNDPDIVAYNQQTKSMMQNIENKKRANELIDDKEKQVSPDITLSEASSSNVNEGIIDTDDDRKPFKYTDKQYSIGIAAFMDGTDSSIKSKYNEKDLDEKSKTLINELEGEGSFENNPEFLKDGLEQNPKIIEQLDLSPEEFMEIFDEQFEDPVLSSHLRKVLELDIE